MRRRGLAPLGDTGAQEPEEKQGDRELAEEILGGGCVNEGWTDDDTSRAFARNNRTAGGGIIGQDGDAASVAALDDTVSGLTGVVVELMPDAAFQSIVLYL